MKYDIYKDTSIRDIQQHRTRRHLNSHCPTFRHAHLIIMDPPSLPPSPASAFLVECMGVCVTMWG